MGRVQGEAWRVGYADVFEPGFLVTAVEQRRAGWGRLFAQRRIQQSRVLVAEIDGTVRGLARFGPVDDDSGAWELFALYVEPSCWGTGVATALISRMHDELRQASLREATLWTLAAARRARRFYEKSGWELTSAHRERDFGDGVARALVRYRLPGSRTRAADPVPASDGSCQ
ncbi:Acetyltransferase (GNAT) family protein [Micromonospora sp. MW-13]|nr:Acetyltransferase (GNAT) family protein [Micromonospora sp. MW-13]